MQRIVVLTLSRKLFLQLEAVDRSWRDWEDDGDWIWEDGGANPRVATTTAAIVDDQRTARADLRRHPPPHAPLGPQHHPAAVASDSPLNPVDTIEDGLRSFLSTSPYATTKFLSYIEQLAKLPNKASMSATEIPDMVSADGVQQPTKGATNKADGTTRNVHEPPPKNTEGGDDVCGSLEDWLHPLPAFDELELPPHMRAIFNKHKDIHAAELKVAAPAPGMCKATANDSSPQQQKKRDTNTGTVNASVTISSPQQPKQPNNLEQGNTSTAQSIVIASSVGKPLGGQHKEC
ncbi:hypothetical protein ZWY2020_009560 [Hordeum vulgare]|nr:hypothetical protein ZWY2020_009560 [Hordeum vulgare]